MISKTLENINIAIVGHTNVGKTSLMRTLTNSYSFGEVKNQSGTTKNIEKTLLKLTKELMITLFDTPGLEEASSVLDFLDMHFKQISPLNKIHSFLKTTAASTKFEQEAKVLNQLLNSDVALYVIDARESILPKYKDELILLRDTAKPILPILNFHEDKNVESWLNLLAELGLHYSIKLDAFKPQNGKYLLFDALKLLLPSKREFLNLFIAQLERSDEDLQNQAFMLIASLIIDIATFKIYNETNIKNLEQVVNKREQLFIKNMLTLYAFPKDQNLPEISFEQGRFTYDLFSIEVLKNFGFDIGSAFLTGATFGVGIDMITGGLSLGAATLLGGSLGVAQNIIKQHGTKIKNFLRRDQIISAPDDILLILLLRSFSLLLALKNIGHANTNVKRHIIRLDTIQNKAEILEFLNAIRPIDELSKLNDNFNKERHNKYKTRFTTILHNIKFDIAQ